MFNSIRIKYIVLIIILLLFILTLTGGISVHASRSMIELWNLGHIVLFGLIVFFLNHYWVYYQNNSNIKRFIIVFILTGVLSIVIESYQYIFTNGTPDMIDIRRNFVGAMLGFICAISMKKKYFLFFLRGLIVLIVLLEMLPLSIVLADEFQALRKFPVLSDFESDLELSRWSGDEPFFRSIDKAIHGNSALYITFGTSKYSGVSLKYFPGDWTNYQYLKFNIYYPDADTLYFICRIHDEQHTKGAQNYHDRFNRRFFLIHGWNEISIPLDDVKNAPGNRRMDMSKIQGMAIFTVQLPKPKAAYLDYVWLE